MDKYIGRLLDNRYEILEVIGTGGMAVVYKARCHRLNRLVAIKILKDDYLEDEDFRRRFHAESQAVAMLSHPNIVSVYDVSTSISMEADYIVMELIEGITLKQYMEKKGVLNWKETLHFAMQIAKALEHAHSRGVVHRDIKPHNVMVLKNGSVKVADFGIARLMSKGDTLTKEALGSVHYISPEQAKGGRVDNRSDIYSLGVVMYEMMSGRPPYEGESPVAVAIQHINGGAVMPSTLNPNIPGGMEQIIMKAMAQDLKNRYPTATQMLTDMDEFRKDPALLFDYNIPPLDAVTSLGRNTYGNVGEKPRTTAQQVERRGEYAPRPRRKQEPATPAVKPRTQTVSSGRSNMATAAIIACSVVAVIAIAVFLIILLNGPQKVEVPSLEGKYFDALQEYPGLKIRVKHETYHEELEDGQIISQEPEAGEMVKYGTLVEIVLSRGKEPQLIYMEDLVGMSEESAKQILDSYQLNLDVEVVREFHSTSPEGMVFITSPSEKTPLEKNQKVTLWVSQGQSSTTEEKKMPPLVGKKMDLAINVLKAYGFPTPECEDVYSFQEPGTVVSQSVEKDKKVPLSTVVKLEISMGPEPTTQPPTEEPTQPESTAPVTTQPPITQDVVIEMPKDIITADGTKIRIMRGGAEVLNTTVDIATTHVTIKNQTGTGTVEYQIYLNDEAKWIERVNFTTDG